LTGIVDIAAMTRWRNGERRMSSHLHGHQREEEEEKKGEEASEHLEGERE